MEVHTCTSIIYLGSLCLLVGAFNPFTFKVIVTVYDPITIFICLGFIFYRSFPSLVFPALRSSFSICFIGGLVVTFTCL